MDTVKVINKHSAKKPKRRNIGRPKKRWKDLLYLEG
jgi:hypothetical protein